MRIDRTARRACVALLILLAFSASAAPSPFADHLVNQWVKQSPREGKASPRFGWEGSAAYDPIDKLVTETTFTHRGGKETTRYWVVALDALGQEGQPSSPAWFGKSYKGFFEGEWHQ